MKTKGDLDLTLEVIILLILGLFMSLFGVLLYRIHAGALPYNPDATYGLFLVIVSFQIITMGKTPFGDFRRSWAIIIIGVCTAILGMSASFTPGSLTKFVRALIGIVLISGGFTLLIQLFTTEERAKMWLRVGGLLRHLAIGCIVVYVLSIALGLITLFPRMATDTQTATLLIAYGVAFFYLSWCVWAAVNSYPLESRPESIETVGSEGRLGIFHEASLPLSLAILILLGILLTFLGFLLFPVNLGLLPFSPDGQFGLLLTVMAIQMMALGDTPLGQFKRSIPIVVIGFAFAGLGVVASIVPGLLTGMIRTLLGLLNLVGGATLLLRRYIPVLRSMRTKSTVSVVVSPAVKEMMTTQTALNSVAIAFGVSTLVPGLVPGLLIAVILVLNGLLLFRLAADLGKISDMGSSAEQATA